MRQLVLLVLMFAALSSGARAKVEPVAIRTPETSGWLGQRLTFFVELRAAGPFKGTASFNMPKLSGVLLMKTGRPVVSSQDIEGKTWFVQSHEFALFSQKSGSLDVPAFPVRFSRRDGFTGPAKDVQGEVPGWRVEIERPPGTEEIGFLVSTTSLEVKETWEPRPGTSKAGTIYKRNIVQRAVDVPGMMLAPAPTRSIDGIDIYRSQPSVNDKTRRGDFTGERRDTITYVLSKPGIYTLPALAYVSWNPEAETLQSITLPAVTFDIVAAAPRQETAPTTGEGFSWLWLGAAALIIGTSVWQWPRISSWAKRLRTRLDPPHQVAARKLMRACRRHDAGSAEVTWNAWLATQGVTFQPEPALRRAILELQRYRYGSTPAVAWNGDELANAFQETRAVKRTLFPVARSSLPKLNPWHYQPPSSGSV